MTSIKKVRSAILICADVELTAQLTELVGDFGFLWVGRSLPRYPTPGELVQILRTHAPELVFLSLESPERAIETITLIEAAAPGTQILALGGHPAPPTLVELMQLGVREWLPFPFDASNLRAAVERLFDLLEKHPPQIECSDQVFGFLPSKGGVGTSTIALNVSLALSRMADSHVLLIDFDLGAGSTQFLLNLHNPNSVMDALEIAIRMDETVWPTLVSRVGRLDVLHAGQPRPDLRPHAIDVQRLLDYVRRTYKTICLDLSGNMEKYSVALLRQCKWIYLVCTPDVISLHQGREKYELQQSLGLADRMSIIMSPGLNPSPVRQIDVERLFGMPVDMTLVKDTKAVYNAIQAGTCVDPAVDLGKQYQQMAEWMLNKKPGEITDVRRSAVEYFSVAPARYFSFGFRP
jgi:pilus assembly protein CpaE